MRVPQLLLPVMTVLVASLACSSGLSYPPGGSSVPNRTRGGVPTNVPGQRATASSEPNASRKRVYGKEEPSTLIATDRSRCMVPSERFKEARIGDNEICDWRAG